MDEREGFRKTTNIIPDEDDEEEYRSVGEEEIKDRASPGPTPHDPNTCRNAACANCGVSVAVGRRSKKITNRPVHLKDFYLGDSSEEEA